MKNLNGMIRKARLGITGLGLIGMLGNGCTGAMMSATGAGMVVGASTKEELVIGAVLGALGDSEVQKEAAREGKTEVNVYGNSATQSLDYSKIPKEFQVMPKIFSCNYWEDKNKNNKIELNEVTGLKTEFYSNEPITLTTELEVEEGGKIEMRIVHNGLNATDLLRFFADMDTVLEEKYNIIKSGTIYVNHTFPPLSLSPGDYRIHVTYQKKSKRFSWNFPHTEALNFKVR